MIKKGVNMKLSTRSKEYIIPEYSLTGDLLSFLTCNLQYRYQNKGNLPPSMPIQLWFGEFIHGVLEEAFIYWKAEESKSLENGEEMISFPWDWEKDIQPIEEKIIDRLKVKGLNPPNDYIYNYGPKENMYSARVDRSINIWGPHLFPLIEDAEVLIKGIRDMPEDNEGNARSEYYSINGVIDVLSSVKLDEISSLINYPSVKEEKKGKSFQQTLDSFFSITSDDINNPKDGKVNRILEYLAKNDEFNKILKKFKGKEYEIIIDYKGMRRPTAPNNVDFDLSGFHLINNDSEGNNSKLNDYKNWIQHEWQILTYAWLRSMQEDAKPVICGIIFYLNELVPSTEDLTLIRDDIRNNKTDIPISDKDWEILDNWNEEIDLPIHRDLSDEFKMDRSIRIVTIKDDLIEGSLLEFDEVVNQIESSMIKELNGSTIKQAWKAEAEERTCNACDFRTFCNKRNSKEENKNAAAFTVP